MSDYHDLQTEVSRLISSEDGREVALGNRLSALIRETEKNLLDRGVLTPLHVSTTPEEWRTYRSTIAKRVESIRNHDGCGDDSGCIRPDSPTDCPFEFAEFVSGRGQDSDLVEVVRGIRYDGRPCQVCNRPTTVVFAGAPGTGSARVCPEDHYSDSTIRVLEPWEVV